IAPRAALLEDPRAEARRGIIEREGDGLWPGRLQRHVAGAVAQEGVAARTPGLFTGTEIVALGAAAAADEIEIDQHVDMDPDEVLCVLVAELRGNGGPPVAA